MTAEPELHTELPRPLQADRLARAGVTVEVVATPAECAALAARYDILAVESLRATVRVKPVSGTRVVRVRGRLLAQVVQTCGVSLEPVPQQVEENFELLFAPEDVAERTGHEVTLSLEQDDPPEPIIGGIIDVGEAVAEHLALALDPFPRAAGAAFKPPPEPEPEPDDVPEPDGKPHPFAALARLQGKNE